MILKNYYWCFSGCVSQKTCEHIIKQGKKSKLSNGRVGPKKYVEDVRNSKVGFINEENLFNLIGDFVRQANRNANWNFQWDWIEPIQFTSYTKKEYYEV